MKTTIRTKICGLSTPETVSAATRAGAGYVGFVFFKKSPRNVSPELARLLASEVDAGVAKVALTVNADNALLDLIVQTVPLDMLQLHGSESPDRVVEVQARYGLPVMKAVGVSGEQDLAALEEYGRVADQLLVDAKPPKGAVLPGATDWLLTGV